MVDIPSRLQTRELGRCFRWCASTGSTNADAAALAEAGAPHGAVVAADAQTSGRGRLGRVWHSPAGVSLYLSVVLRPAVSPGRLGQLAPLVGLAVRAVLARAAPAADVRVKWPNDVWARGGKIAGILCQGAIREARVEHVVVGIGINVNATQADVPPELAGRATSLRLEAGAPCDREQLLADLLLAVEERYARWLSAADLAADRDEWRRHSYLCGRAICVESGKGRVVGTACGISVAGELLVRQDNGSVCSVNAGDAHVLLPGATDP